MMKYIHHLIQLMDITYRVHNTGSAWIHHFNRLNPPGTQEKKNYKLIYILHFFFNQKFTDKFNLKKKMLAL